MMRAAFMPDEAFYATTGIGVFVSVLLLSPLSTSFLANLSIQSAFAIATGVSIAQIAALVYAAKKSAPVFDRNNDYRNQYMPSDEPEQVGTIPFDGLRIGYCVDTMKSINLPGYALVRHGALIGQSGVGKTTTGMYLLAQQYWRGGGGIFLDAKTDLEARNQHYGIAKSMGRAHDFMCLNINDGSDSHSYNPIMWGDADEKASRLMNLIPESGQSAGADYYRASAEGALNALFALLDSQKRIYTALDLAILLQAPNFMLGLAKTLDMADDARLAMDLLLNQYTKVNKDGEKEVKAQDIADRLGGIGQKIARFSMGEFGKIFNTTTPEIVLKDIICEGKILHIMLPTMSKNEASINFAKMFVSDLRSAVGTINNLPQSQKPRIPFLAFLDEFAPYATEDSRILFEQARSAKVIFMPGIQSPAQLKKVHPTFAETVLQNTWFIACSKFGEQKNAEEISKQFGNMRDLNVTYTSSASTSDSKENIRVDPTEQHAQTLSGGFTYREEDKPWLTPERLMAFTFGESAIQIGGSRFHAKTPELKVMGNPSFSLSRFKGKSLKNFRPLNLAQKFREQNARDDAHSDAIKDKKGQYIDAVEYALDNYSSQIPLGDRKKILERIVREGKAAPYKDKKAVSELLEQLSVDDDFAFAQNAKKALQTL